MTDTSPTPVIDAHAHYLPEAIGAAAAEGRLTGILEAERESGGYRFRFVGERPLRGMPTVALLDLDERIQWMDARSIDRQVVGPWPDLFGYELDADKAETWCRFANEAMLESLDDQRRLIPLATLPMQAPHAAAEMLVEARKEGFAGAMIQTRIGEVDLDDASFEPVWSAAAESSMPIFIHPEFLADEPRVADMGLTNAVGRGIDTTISGARLLYSGVPQRHPGLKLVLSHGGGALPYIAGRLRRNHELRDDTFDPKEGFELLYFDSVVFDTHAFRLLCAMAGPGHLLCGSDYPFPMGDLDPAKVIRESDLGAHDLEDILGANALRVCAG